MKARKYLGDYRVTTDVDARTGKARSSAVYEGDRFRFESGTPKSRALRALPELAGYWALALVFLVTCRATGRCAYALLPFLAAQIPAAYACMGFLTLLRAPEAMTSLQRDSGPARLTRGMLGAGVLSTASAIGCAVCLSVNGTWSDGFLEFILAALSATAALGGFRVGKKMDAALVREEKSGEGSDV